MDKRRRGKRRTRRQQNRSINYMPVILLIIIIVAGYIWKGDQIIDRVQGVVGSFEVFNKQSDKVPQDTSICMEGNVVKILVYTLGLDVVPQEEETRWYSKYYNALDQERFSFFSEEDALKPMTYKKTSQLVQELLGGGYDITLQSPSGDEEEIISFNTFLGIYEETISYVPNSRPIRIETLGILATPGTDNTLQAWETFTDKGLLGFEGLTLDPYKDCTVEALLVGDEILGVIEFISASCLIERCYVEQVQDDLATIKIGDQQISYKNSALTPESVGGIYNIVITDGKITIAEEKQREPDDHVLRVTDEYIEFEQAGTLGYQDLSIYDATSFGNWKTIGQVASGTGVSFVEEDGIVNTLTITDRSINDQVRVLISQDGMNNYFHEEIIVTATGNYLIKYGEQEMHLPSGSSFDVSRFTWEEGQNKIIITPLQQENTLQLMTVKRQAISPSYKGQIEISREDNGMYTVVNQVYLDDYLAAVIPSEMPTSYGLEALKVQAIATRSYVASHQSNSKFACYGAQVDDTTATQVYNNVPADELSYQAARETEGIVLKHNDQIVSGNFFSTSAGCTANYGEVWAQGEIFPTNTPAYLVAVEQYIRQDPFDLTAEDGAYDFFTLTADEIDAFDDHAPWFRWQIEWTPSQISTSINNNIYRLSQQYPNLIKVLDSNNHWSPTPVEDIGTVQSIKIQERGEGGNVMKMQIIGDKHTIQVSTEYVIRSLLAPMQKSQDQETVKIVRADGSVIENMMMLPSSFFTIETIYDKNNQVQQFNMYGGGFGHGVGMSQEGVKGMVERGYDYEQILNHYYPNVQIVEY